MASPSEFFGQVDLNQLAAWCGAAVLIVIPLILDFVDVTPKRDHGSSRGLGAIMDRIEQGFVVTAWVMIAAAAICLIW
jgi:hypothetical protein